MKYAVINDGFPQSFYAEDVHGPRDDPDTLIPAAAVEITDEQWRELLENQGRRKWQDGEVVEYEPPPPPLEDIKDTLKVRLDADAERERLKYITPGAGQAMTYQQKAAEAAACLADPDPDPADYPLLAAEIGITGADLLDVATVVAGQHQAWRVIGSMIEAARLGGKAAIENATSAEDAQTAFEAALTALGAVGSTTNT